MEEYCGRSAGHYHGHGGGGGGGAVAAPFVLKTYRMVDDPSTDAVIAWGRDNNSFVVVDPFAFSQTLLPSHFKHGNFSSFVRQLNTYGFRKVDPDRWEFAHASFLRGQTHLLRQIVRRNSGGVKKKKGAGEEEVEDDDDEEKVAAEVVRLKQEQRRIEERVQGMWRRVQETERRPRQMLAFLVKVAGDPQLLGCLQGTAEAVEGGEKRARLRAGGDDRDDGDWQFDGEGLAVGEGEVCGGDGGGGANELLGTVDQSAGLCGGGGPTWVGSEYGGVEVDVGGGPMAAFPLSFHVENGFY
ncbi:heat stress transcription factor C-2a-like [Canna indica]|uniref:Heat stress transcription factor C-2a-like n=1 Tax=Canna indica TaxID=4628 RepID=A0AAQ3KQD5_9LILI|nr:heat stress transcription factor C-2a-like [Canna indica]